MRLFVINKILFMYKYKIYEGYVLRQTGSDALTRHRFRYLTRGAVDYKKIPQ